MVDSINYAVAKAKNFIYDFPDIAKLDPLDQSRLFDIFKYIYVGYLEGSRKKERIDQILRKFGLTISEDVTENIFMYTVALYRDGWVLRIYGPKYAELKNIYEPEKRTHSPRQRKLV